MFNPENSFYESFIIFIPNLIGMIGIPYKDNALLKFPFDCILSSIYVPISLFLLGIFESNDEGKTFI